MNELKPEDVMKALECCAEEHCGEWCAFYEQCPCEAELSKQALALLREKDVRIKELEYTLLGVMHSVDKWLDGAELEQDEVNRACDMREKTLKIVEEKDAEIARLTEENERFRKLSEEGAECPSCYGLGKIGTTNWLTKHLSKEQIAKEKSEAIARFHRELKADAVRKMSERLKSCFEDDVKYDGFRIAIWIDRIAKEMVEEK